jgi:four helix bundle protein
VIPALRDEHYGKRHETRSKGQVKYGRSLKRQERHMGNENTKGYRNLLVWQNAHELTLLIYKASKIFPRDELHGLTNQMRRAAVSIPANIAEGYARAGKKELLQFLYIAKGSLAEVEYYVELSKDLEYIDRAMYENLEEKRQLVGKLLYGFIASIKRK